MSHSCFSFSTPRKLFHGAAYYPELWPRNSIERDIELMLKAGINLVRMGEFAWSTMEPSPGEFHFELFGETMDRFAEAGIGTVLCTPTATPPIWLSHGHPERCFVNADGVRMSHGARQHIDTDHPYVRERACIIATELSRALGRHPALVAWQTDNEFKCHVRENFSDSAKTRWASWLEERFETIEALNEAWGTRIWSEEYQNFAQVPMPWPTPCMHNASLETAFKRFAREMIAEYQAEQVAAIRKYSEVPITHNGNLTFHFDQELIYRDLDFAAFDHYAPTPDYDEMLLHYERWRTLKPDRSFWVLETGAAHNGSIHAGHAPYPLHYVRAEAVAAYASGALCFGYWVWRQQRTGVEQPHGCVISAWQEPTIGYVRVQAANEARQELEPYILSTQLRTPEIALLWSDHARIFLETEHHGELDYLKLMRSWAKRLRDAGFFFDLIGESADLSPYKLIFTPFSLNISEALVDQLSNWVESGGTWIAGPLTGGRTAHHTVPTTKALGTLETFAGVKTIYTCPISNTGTIGHALGRSAPLSHWSHFFEPRSAIARGIASGGPAHGAAYLTEKLRRKGRIVLLGACPDGEAGDRQLAAINHHYADAAKVTLRFESSPGTIVLPRTDGEQESWVIVNLDGNGGAVNLPRPASDVFSRRVENAGSLLIEPYAHRILEFSPRNHHPMRESRIGEHINAHSEF